MLLILTGTSGAGKSSIADGLLRSGIGVKLVQAVTTRAPRADDRPDQYRYLDRRQFDQLANSGGLMISAFYRSESYGIAWTDIEEQVESGRPPMVVITPKSYADLATQGSRAPNAHPMPRLSIFVDAPDEVLDERLLTRDGRLPEDAASARTADRFYASYCDRVMLNLDLQRSIVWCELLWRISYDESRR